MAIIFFFQLSFSYTELLSRPKISDLKHWSTWPHDGILYDSFGNIDWHIRVISSMQGRSPVFCWDIQTLVIVSHTSCFKLIWFWMSNFIDTSQLVIRSRFNILLVILVEIIKFVVEIDWPRYLCLKGKRDIAPGSISLIVPRIIIRGSYA